MIEFYPDMIMSEIIPNNKIFVSKHLIIVY